jgi:hypothetical protein
MVEVCVHQPHIHHIALLLALLLLLLLLCADPITQHLLSY